MKPVLFALTSLLLSALASGAAGNCLTDTSQADFQTGTTATSVDTAASPGNVLLSTSGGGGGGSVDQQNTTIAAAGWTFSNSMWVGQTFTAGRSGGLTQIDLNLFCNNCMTSQPVVVSVRATSGGLPTGSDLATTTITVGTAGVQAWYSANFASPTTVSSGTQYAILIRAGASISANFLYFSESAIAISKGNDVYAGGALVVSGSGGSPWSVAAFGGTSPTADGGFKTYVGGSVGYSNAGNLISSAKDSNPGAGTTSWSTLSWTNSLPSGTNIRFQAAASNTSTGPFNFVGPDGTSGSYFTSTGASLSQFNGNRYLKYRAYLSTSSGSATPTLNDATACFTTSGSADLSINNSDGATTATPGEPISYTITASNAAGSSSVSGATVTDAFPQTLSSCAWTCSGLNGGTCPASGSGNINSSVNLPGGASVTFSATCNVAASATGSLSNTASIAAPAGVNDTNTANNSMTDTDTLAPQADLTISNSDGVTTANPGGTVTYTIKASNPGPSGVVGATVADTFPSSLTCNWSCSGAGGGTCTSSGSGNINNSVNLPGGASVTFLATCSISASASGTLTNTASVATPAGVTDPTPGNNGASDSDTLAVKADIQVTMSDGVDGAQLGDVVTYVINITNAGPSNANTVNVDDALPAQLNSSSWVCSGTGGATCKAGSGNNTINTSASIPAGGKVTYVYTATVASDNSMDTFTNTATAALSSGTDPNAANNSASDTDQLVVFWDGFEVGQSLAMNVATAGAGASFFTAQLGVDAALLNRLGTAPVTIASGRAANGKSLFSVQLIRLGTDVAMRTLTRTDDGIFSDVSAWQTIDIKSHVLTLDWQSASARGNDGYLNVEASGSQMLVVGRNAKDSVTHLQIAVENSIPWLVPIEP